MCFEGQFAPPPQKKKIGNVFQLLLDENREQNIIHYNVRYFSKNISMHNSLTFEHLFFTVIFYISNIFIEVF